MSSWMTMTYTKHNINILHFQNIPPSYYCLSVGKKFIAYVLSLISPQRKISRDPNSIYFRSTRSLNLLSRLLVLQSHLSSRCRTSCSAHPLARTSSLSASPRPTPTQSTTGRRTWTRSYYLGRQTIKDFLNLVKPISKGMLLRWCQEMFKCRQT